MNTEGTTLLRRVFVGEVFSSSPLLSSPLFRLGSKLTASGSQELSKSPLGVEPGARCGPLGPEPGAVEAWPGGRRPLHAEASGAVHHIRNPKLRQYYLLGRVRDWLTDIG